MSRKTFRNFRLNDITGGINTKDFPTEIEDKQMLQLTNWNFSGNKLVSWKGSDIVYTGNWRPIQGLTVDGNEFWHVEGGSVYKNWVVQYKSNTYTFTIADPANEMLSIWIDGTNYTFQIDGTGYTDLTTQLSAALWVTYSVTYLWGTEYTIERDDFTAISFSEPDLIKSIVLSDWDALSQTTITIDGVATILTWDADKASTLATLVAALPWGTYYTDIDTDTLLISRIDATAAPVISEVSLSRYTYVLSGTSGRPWSSNVQFLQYNDVFWVGGTGSPTVFNTEAIIDWKTQRYYYVAWNTDSTVTENVTYSTWDVYSGTNQILHTAKMVDLIYNNGGGTVMGASYVMENLAISSAYWTNDTASFDIRKTDYSAMSSDFTPNGIFINNGATTTLWYSVSFYVSSGIPVSMTETNHTGTVTISTYTEVARSSVNNGTQFKDKGLFNILVSSDWILIYSRNTNEQSTITKNPKQVFIDLAGVITDIPSWIWEPTAATFYNGKTVFWQYYDDGQFNDNITFSKTYDPVSWVNEFIDFSGYSAGAQSVSWGNKGRITGFVIWENWLYAFKNNEVWYSNTEKDSGTSFNFIFKKISSNWTLNQQCIAEVEQEIMYYDHLTRAVRRLGYERDLTTLRDVSISKDIESILKEIPDDTATENYSGLISMSFEYPILTLNITTPTSPDVYIDQEGSDSDWKFKAPNRTIEYNVENKAWSEETKKTTVDNYAIHNYKGYYATDNWDIYRDGQGNTDELGTGLSKEYTFTDDVDMKRIGEIEIVGQIIPETWLTKTFEFEVLVDDVAIDLQTDWTTTRRIISSTTDPLRFTERVNLYNDGQKFQFRPLHSWDGRVEVSDVNMRWKGLDGYSIY